MIGLADIEAGRVSDFTVELIGHVFSNLQLEGRPINPVARAGVAISTTGSSEKTLTRKALLALAEATAADALPINFSSVSEAHVRLESLLEDQLAGADGARREKLGAAALLAARLRGVGREPVQRRRAAAEAGEDAATAGGDAAEQGRRQRRQHCGGTDDAGCGPGLYFSWCVGCEG